MEPQTKVRISAKDFFLNLGATIALYTTVGSLISLLFTIINTAYPKVTNGYSYFGSTSISWPVSILLIFFPVFILLMWVLGKQYEVEPERRYNGVHKWLTYLTLFVAGLTMVIDLITIVYYFIDGQELTTGFVLKVLALLIIAFSIFSYYLADIQGKLTSSLRTLWRIVSTVAIVGAIIWGFTVLGSPRTQRLYKYDEQKVNDLMSINNEINNYYSLNGKLPENLSEIVNNYYINLKDAESDKPYEYIKTGSTSYQLCAEFNKDNKVTKEINHSLYPYGNMSWAHEAGRHCFNQTINPNMYTKPVPFR